MREQLTFGPIRVEVGRSDPPIAIVLKQIDGLYRVAFSCEAAEVADAIERGAEQGEAFGLCPLTAVPTGQEAAARSRRFIIEMTLALEWAWQGVEGVPAEGLWSGGRASIAYLLQHGDPEADVPPLATLLGGWFNGALVVTAAEGERFGPSQNGDGAAGPNTAKGAVH